MVHSHAKTLAKLFDRCLAYRHYPLCDVIALSMKQVYA